MDAIQLNNRKLETRAKGGQPSKLETLNTELVKKLYEKGFTDKEVAEVIGVTEQTINNWKKYNEGFFESLKKWKLKADENVVKSLYERATGYSHPEEKIMQYEGQVIRAETTKHYPPDPLSIIFWLKNRQPELWRDRQEVEFTKPLEIVLKDYRGKEVEPPAAAEASYKEIENTKPEGLKEDPEQVQPDQGSKTEQETPPKV